MIDVLIVDDSAFMRQVLKKNIDKQNNMKTIAIARNGNKGLTKIKKYSPDVITLDIEMPEMNGLETLKTLKEKKYDIPVIMVSALNNKETVMEALDLGAFDFIAKPSGSISLDIDEIMEDYIKKIKAANHSKSNNQQLSQNQNIKTKKKRINYTSHQYPVIATGASSGGPKVIEKLINSLPENFKSSIIIVQHMPAGCGLVQDKSAALVYGMPQAVIDKNAYDEICSLKDISEKLKKIGKNK